MLWLCGFRLTAQNLVPNGGFEDHRGKGHSMYWTQPTGEFNHFYHQHLNPQFGGAAQGEGYHCLCMYGMQPNEFMHVALKNKMEKGRVYELSMYTRVSYGGDEVYKNDNLANLKQIDWYFTATPINVLSKLFITAEPSASFPYNGRANKDWQKTTLSYTANGDEEFLTIGNITRFYQKIRADEKLDSLQTRYDLLKSREKHEADSIRELHSAEFISSGTYSQSDFSMNPYVKSKKKKISRKQRKANQRAIEHNQRVGARIGLEQDAVYRKYRDEKVAIEYMVDHIKNQYAVNICFDEISIVPTNEKVEPVPLSLSNLQPQSGTTLVLKNILFATGSYELKAESNAQLNQLMQWLNKNPDAKIQISGHTDNVGDEKSNLVLSDQRAKAVVNYLVANGIGAQRLQHKGYGSMYSLSDNTTEMGRSLNRRVEITIL